MKFKNYENYDAYLKHQSTKLRCFPEEIRSMNKQIREIIKNRYEYKFNWKGKTVMCFGARLGGEVDAFKKLGAVAIGIDIEPGLKNEHVLYGDFHKTNFDNESFDYVYCNSIDHAFSLDQFFTEAKRILKPNGILLLEVAVQKAGIYEAIDTEDISDLDDIVKRYFHTLTTEPISNVWEGVLLVLTKTE